MHHTFVLIKRGTQTIDGVVSTHLDDLDAFNYNKETHDLLIVQPEHPILHDRHRYYQFSNGEVIRRPQVEIDVIEAAEWQRRQIPPTPSDAELLLRLVNELRADKGLPPTTLDNLRRQQ